MPTFEELFTHYVSRPLLEKIDGTTTPRVVIKTKEELDELITQAKCERHEKDVTACYYRCILADHDRYIKQLEEDRRSLDD